MKVINFFENLAYFFNIRQKRIDRKHADFCSRANICRYPFSHKEARDAQRAAMRAQRARAESSFWNILKKIQNDPVKHSKKDAYYKFGYNFEG